MKKENTTKYLFDEIALDIAELHHEIFTEDNEPKNIFIREKVKGNLDKIIESVNKFKKAYQM